MTLGFIATPIAYMNMQRAKRRYEEALKKSELLNPIRARYQQEIDSYELRKSILDSIHLGIQQDGAEVAAPLPGLQIAYNLQVGKLGGKNMSAQIILKIKNGSKKAMRLTAFQFMDLKAFKNIPFTDYNPFYKTDSIQNPIELKPGEGCELEVGAWEARPLLSKDNLKMFRDTLATVAGKRYFTSLKSGFVDRSAVKCDTFGVNYIYQLESGEWVASQALFKNVLGNIEYMGGTWMPVDLGLGKIILKTLLSLFTFSLSDVIWDQVEDSKK